METGGDYTESGPQTFDYDEVKLLIEQAIDPVLGNVYKIYNCTVFVLFNNIDRRHLLAMIDLIEETGNEMNDVVGTMIDLATTKTIEDRLTAWSNGNQCPHCDICITSSE